MKYKVTYLDENSIRKSEYFDLQREEIIHKLNQGNSRIISIEDLNKDREAISLGRTKKIRLKDIASFLKQLSILLESGLDFKMAIGILKDQEKNTALKDSLEEINKNLDSGFSISQSFQRTGKFPSLLCGVIEAGETSSRLYESLRILSDYYEDEQKTKQTLRNALYYPVILLIVTLIVTILVVTIVLPRYVDLFSYYDSMELPALTRGLISTSNFLMARGWIIILFIIALGFGINRLLSESVRKKIAKNRLSYPVIGSYLLTYEIQRFSGIFSLLISSGIETMEAIEKSAKSINNLYLRDRISSLSKEILEGHTLYKTFSKIEVLPPMFVNLINVGELSSNLAETMDMSYLYYKNILGEKSKKLTALFEPLIIILVSLIVGTVVIAIALPMFSLVNLVNF